MHCLLI
jgi:hypothetical protein